MWLCILYGRQLEETFENSQWRKSIKCNQCDYATPQADNLRSYLKTHCGEKQNSSASGRWNPFKDMYWILSRIYQIMIMNFAKHADSHFAQTKYNTLSMQSLLTTFLLDFSCVDSASLNIDHISKEISFSWLIDYPSKEI